MPKNTLISLLVAYSTGLLAGLLSLLMLSLILSGHFTVDPDDFLFSSQDLSIVVGVILSFAAPFVFSIGILLPLAAIDKNKIEQFSFADLLKRYGPLLTIPFGILFCLVFFMDFNHDNDKYATLMLLLTLFGICSACLWFFIRRLKSS